MSTRTDVIKTAGRIFEILEYFDEAEKPLGLVELVERFGYPQSSMAALLKSLVVLGYLHHDRAARSYVPTSKLASLGQWAEGLLLDSPGVAAMAAELGDLVSETVVLGVRNDLMAQYVYVRLAPRPLMYHNSAGALRPLCRSGIGWAILSTMRDEAVRKIVRRYNAAEENSAGRVDVPGLVKTVQGVRSRGYAFSEGAYSPGVGMIAMPLPRRAGARLMAIGVGGPIERLKLSQVSIVQHIRAVSERHFGASRSA